MSKLKPIGSEKLEGMDKIQRILEIARYNEHIPNPVNETSKDAYSFTSVDGVKYDVVREKLGYVIKKQVNESVDYLEPMKNRTYYRSYSQAMKKLNLIIKENNRVLGFNEETPLLGEQKKFVLKTPKPEAEPTPAPSPAPEAEPTPALPPVPEDDMGMEDMPPAPEGDMAMDDMGMEDDMSDVEPIDTEVGGEDDEEVTFKQIQKLTGKLGQKIRSFETTGEMTSEDVKYVLNSIISALDLTKLDDEDIEDITSKFEDLGGSEDMGMEDDEMGDMGMEDDEMGDEMPAGEETEGYHGKMDSILDELFTESKVDKIISKYIKESNIDKKIISEQRLIQDKKMKQVKSEIIRLSETYEQESVATSILKENKKMRFVGKTNKGNLVFEYMDQQIKVSPKGRLV
jgi:hypothetical protein